MRQKADKYTLKKHIHSVLEEAQIMCTFTATMLPTLFNDHITCIVIQSLILTAIKYC